MYREKDYHDFPLPAGMKAPPPTGWKELAGKIEIPEGANGGVSTDNFSILDFDNMELAREFYKTRRDIITTLVKTPRGLHSYHSGLIKNFRAEGYDGRGVGGYGVGAGSIVEGKRYEFVEGHELVRPDELKPFPIEMIPVKGIPEIHRIEELSDIRRIRRARAWIARREPAVSGQGGHNQFFKVCCGLFQFFGVSMQEATPIILEYNQTCLPPFNDREVEHKLNDAFKASQRSTA